MSIKLSVVRDSHKWHLVHLGVRYLIARLPTHTWVLRGPAHTITWCKEAVVGLSRSGVTTIASHCICFIQLLRTPTNLTLLSSAAAMDLPSTSYISQSAKLPFSWSNSGELLAEHVGRNGEERPLQYSSRSPEIKSDDMDSVYSDAGDTFASRPCNNGYENHEGVASPRRTDVNARDFILRRFLPAAQAMATEGSSSATSTSLASDQRYAIASQPGWSIKRLDITTLWTPQGHVFVHLVAKIVPQFIYFVEGWRSSTLPM